MSASALERLGVAWRVLMESGRRETRMSRAAPHSAAATRPKQTPPQGSLHTAASIRQPPQGSLHKAAGRFTFASDLSLHLTSVEHRCARLAAPERQMSTHSWLITHARASESALVPELRKPAEDGCAIDAVHVPTHAYRATCLLSTCLLSGGTASHRSSVEVGLHQARRSQPSSPASPAARPRLFTHQPHCSRRVAPPLHSGGRSATRARSPSLP